MGRRITTDRPRHLYSAETLDEIRAASAAGREISDAAALTVASWWQGPSFPGRAFAELSTTGSVDVDELCREVGATYPETLALPAVDRLALDMLSTWALNHPSGSDADGGCAVCGEPYAINGSRYHATGCGAL